MKLTLDEFHLSLVVAVITSIPRWRMARAMESESLDDETGQRKGGIVHGLYQIMWS